MDVDQHVEGLIDAHPDAVIAAYRRKFSVPRETLVTAAMVRTHWRIERQGTAAILASDSASRADVTAEAYGAVFGQCPWRNTAGERAQDPERAFSHFLKLLRPAHRVYEVGSGNGELIAWLAGKGFRCVATEITRERGAQHASTVSGLEWHATDGVNLTRYEPLGSFDAVLSNQVLEHLHPEDVATHFAAAAALLKPGGRYVLATPHRLCGPADLSEVFALERPVCFHLREYSYDELVPVLKRCGFARVRAVYTTPVRMRGLLDLCLCSGLYLAAMRGAERVLDRLPLGAARRIVAVLYKLALWRPDVTLVAEKAR
jgi:2-polyprenyl-3-methyl-5-hydroxy-6-metoxy-1,4-benzoquinol methylase